MTSFTILIYHYFRKHRIVFWALLISTTFLFTFFSLKINLEEDITKLLPSTGKDEAELIFSNLKVKDKIFILFNPKGDEVYPDDLINAGNEFVESLLLKDTVNHTIQDILFNIDGSLMENGITFLYSNIPTYLDSASYSRLDQLLDKTRIEEQMNENYSLLRSPAGGAYKNIIVHDPIAIRNILHTGVNNMGSGLGGNFTIFNNHIFTPDSSILIAFLSPNFDSFDSKRNVRLSKLIENEIADFQKTHPSIEISYHGSPVQGVYNARRIKTDLVVTISFSLILILMILLYCFKNKSTLAYLLMPVGYGVLFALCVMYFLKGSISLMALGIGAIIMGVAFSYCMHIITHYKYVNDPIIVLKDQTVPVILGSLTTIGAFLGLLLTKSELLQDFGLFASLGLVGTTFFCLFFTPQFFNPGVIRKSKKAFSLIEKINTYPFEKKGWLIITIVIICGICIYFAVFNKVKFDSDLRNIGYNEEKIIASRSLLESKSSGNMSTIYFATIADNLDDALTYNHRLCNKLDELVADSTIGGYTAPASLFIPKQEQLKRIERWNSYWTDERKAEVRKNVTEAALKNKFTENTFVPFFNLLDAEYEPVSLYESNVIPDEILNNIIEYSDNKYMVFVPVQMSRAELIEIGKRVTEGNEEHFVVVDPMFYTSDMVSMLHNDFNITVGISSLFVLFILLISYRSIVLALLAFLPMGLSWYVVLGSMAMLGMEFNLINIVISTFIFGIGVDYSIFVMDGLVNRYRTKDSTLMYHKTAIFFSAVILIIVITSLLFAVHPAISSIGVVTLIGMGATIIIAYTLLPYLFAVLISHRARLGKAPVSVRTLFTFGKSSAVNQLKNNYLYKGNKIERALYKELKATKNYNLIREAVTGKKRLLDFGSGYGFTSYWAAIVNSELDVTGFETDVQKISLAEYCYQKTKQMQFTISSSALTEKFDVVIINKDLDAEPEIMENILSSASTVVIRKIYGDTYNKLLQKLHFEKKQEDSIFTVFEK